MQAFPGHKGPVSCLTFRQGTAELFSGSFDRSVKIWNAEDRTYISTLFGHQSEVLTIDSLRKERVLTVGRDRTMHLWKVIHLLKALKYKLVKYIYLLLLLHLPLTLLHSYVTSGKLECINY